MIRKRHLPISKIAAMASCEKKVELDLRYGEQLTRFQRSRTKAGNLFHQEQHRAATHYMGRQCFIATAVYGEDAPETERLRQFRDNVLLPRWYGRWLISAYYRLSPSMATLVHRSSWLRRRTHALLDRVVAWIS